ncbi:pyruvate dehydrogenase E2 component (dihydrolipoamide acetyltransferase) [Williamsia limnetica]|uniref:Dihydrolipoamide acetyltransferase component of pyruvate dehydrogenase complex n=1 Tax=Williamsia limnetica TaxID=882452 RepID=A0A318RRZ4_WILLI|nr:dihydrolipoamide acetyltransferase family protein [Williamsia limnetica]PYE18543.1 pyruvate dehydrogenase E2 component (dihydrolipoamide acetyltransferase) [Williamsia limnetica]
MPTIQTFLLPDLGEGLTDAELLTWLVEVGDTVELNQNIADVETAKASVELPSPYAGTVVALHAEEGTTVEVGSPFIDIEVAGAHASDPPEPTAPEPTAPEPTAAEPAPERTPVLVGYGVAAESTGRRRRRSEPAVEVATPAQQERPLAAPPVRYAARRSGVDLKDVQPTGSRGEVTRDDLEQYLAQPAVDEPAASVAPARLDEERSPIKGVRKHTAAAMVQSAFTAPHVTEFITTDVTPMMDLLGQLKQSKHFETVRITPLALVAKALLVALRTNPSLNSSWDEANQEIVTKRYVNLGIAAATPRGLMVPNIKNAHTFGLRDLAQALVTLTTTAKEGRTGPDDLSAGTITITNVGVFGVDSGTPILNPGEAAILCFGAIRRQPWEFEGEIALRSITTLSLSFDHRLVDGEQGSRFLATIADILSDPISLIALS